MGNSNDLKSYLLHWKEHFASDVAGQSEGAHLNEETLAQMARSLAGIDNTSAADIEHLSTCPDCLERWAAHFKFEGGVDTPQQLAMPAMSYGVMVEDDVCGQSTGTQSRSQCGRFVLLFLLAAKPPTLTLTVNDPELEGRNIQVRDRTGQIILAGQVQQSRLTGDVDDPQGLDLAVWTVMVGEQD